MVSRVKAAGLVPNNEPMPLMYGPPHHCASCGMPITRGPERQVDRPAQPGEHMRRAGMPNVVEARALYDQGLIDPRGHYLPWWGVVFTCASCLDRWRNAPPIAWD